MIVTDEASGTQIYPRAAISNTSDLRPGTVTQMIGVNCPGNYHSGNIDAKC